MTFSSALRALRAFTVLLVIATPSLAQAQSWCNLTTTCNTSWTWRRQLVLGNAQTVSPVNDFSVMVKLDATRVDYSKFAANGADLRFLTSDQASVLPHEIEVWNPSGTSIIWVKMASLSDNNTSAGSIWMYWGNPQASDAQQVNGTWNPGYRGVWHLQGTGESTDETADLTLTGVNGLPVTTTGKIGGAYNLDGFDDYLALPGDIDLADWLGEADGSLEFWIRSTDGPASPGANTTVLNSPGVTGVVDTSANVEVAFGWVLTTTANAKSLQVSGDGAVGVGVSAIDGNWHHVVLTRDGTPSGSGNVTTYLDGVLDDASTDGGGGASESTSFRDFGRLLGSTDAFLDADLDEIRILSSIATADWVAANYQSQNDTLIGWTCAPTSWFVDNDGDGHVGTAAASCNTPFGGTTVSDDVCDSNPANPVHRNNWTAAGCNISTGCKDRDGDFYYSLCDSYQTIFQDHCDTAGQVVDENSNTVAACNPTTGCGDRDGDGKYSACNDENTITKDFCDVDGNPISENNWTSAACAGACTDVDTDKHFVGCDIYTVTTAGVFEGFDNCDTTSSDPLGRNNWTVASCNPTTGCKDRDGDLARSVCDSYATITQDNCDTDGVLVHENNWTQSGCTACADGDGDTRYSGCDNYLPTGPFAITHDYCDVNGVAISENNYTEAACTGGCNDTDTDKRFEGCNGYGFTDSSFLGQDHCDTANTDPEGRNNWTTTGCANCDDDDGDFFFVDCDAYAFTVLGDFEGQDCLDTDVLVNPKTDWYLDGDGDSYGSTTEYGGNPVCVDPGASYVLNDDDCADGDPSLNPTTPWYRDVDGDGLGNPSVSVLSCTNPSSGGTVYQRNDDDCNDTTSTIGAGLWYRDVDGDGFGALTPTTTGCTQPGGYSANHNDCNDNVAAIKPGGAETCGDGIDGNCDGQGGPDDDDDGDGHAFLDEDAAGSSDCDTDSDNDGVSDTIEWAPIGGGTGPRDSDDDGAFDVNDNDDDGDGLLTELESDEDKDGAPACGFAPDGYPSYVDVDSDGDGVCDGAYVPTAGECLHWQTVDRDPNTAGVQPFQESLGIGAANDHDADGVSNVNDYDDFDGGACDTDGDGLPSLVEITICYKLTEDSPPEKCLDPADSDTDGDGAGDGVEVGTNTASPRDTDGDTLPDWWDLDDDNDLVLTLDEDYDDPPTSPDPTDDHTDDDGVPDYRDDDDDGDGVLTADEDSDGDGHPENDDIDGDATPDYLDFDDSDGPVGDHDGDGVTNGDEALAASDPDDPDSDGDGVLDGLEWEDDLGSRLDTDGDTVFDVLDEDDDGDGIPTRLEGSWDADHDGAGNHVDTDADGDGVTDRLEGGDAYEADLPLPDTDDDGVPDFLDATADAIDPDGSTDPDPVDDDAGCACGSVPGSSGAFGALAFLALALARRKPARPGAAAR